MPTKIAPEQAEEIVQAYRAGRSVTALARAHGVTRQALYALFHRLGEPRRNHARVERACGQCGAPLLVLSHRSVRSRAVYCNSACYAEKMRTTDYQEWRHGRRIAHDVVMDFYPLLYGQVVHHKDNDERNNDPANLMVFASQADHTRWHRGGGEESGVVPLWRGDQWAFKKATRKTEGV